MSNQLQESLLLCKDLNEFLLFSSVPTASILSCILYFSLPKLLLVTLLKLLPQVKFTDLSYFRCSLQEMLAHLVWVARLESHGESEDFIPIRVVVGIYSCIRKHLPSTSRRCKFFVAMRQ
uniref:Uncharacterized protein n=1 Tax=Aegilops tauschii subsp. strangulata TaxID=200361 RepID=A0A453R9B3_AEGTS